MDLKIIPMIRVDNTDGMNTIPRCIFRRRMDLVRRRASIRPITFFSIVVIKVNSRVFDMIFI